MSRRWPIAFAVALLLHAPSAWAQRATPVRTASSAIAPSAFAPSPAEALVATTPPIGPSRAEALAEPEQTLWWVGPDPVADQTRVFTEFLTQLPIERVQRVLKSPAMFRVAEAGVGAAVVSYAATRSDLSAHALYAGVQAIRFAGGDALSPGGFHIEPSVSGSGVAIFLRRRID